MKTLILLVLCALVATTYAAPGIFWNQAKEHADISQAESQFWGSLLKGTIQVRFEDDDGEDDLANIEALISQSLHDRAEMEGFFDVLKKAGKLALKVAPHVIGGEAEIQGDKSEAEAQFWASVLKGGLSMLGKKN